jgi:hypothetical protein
MRRCWNGLGMETCRAVITLEAGIETSFLMITKLFPSLIFSTTGRFVSMFRSKLDRSAPSEE